MLNASTRSDKGLLECIFGQNLVIIHNANGTGTFLHKKIINIEKRYTEDEIKKLLIRKQVKDFIL